MLLFPPTFFFFTLLLFHFCLSFPLLHLILSPSSPLSLSSFHSHSFSIPLLPSSILPAISFLLHPLSSFSLLPCFLLFSILPTFSSLQSLLSSPLTLHPSMRSQATNRLHLQLSSKAGSVKTPLWHGTKMAAFYPRGESRPSIAVSWMDEQSFSLILSQEMTRVSIELWWGTVLGSFHCEWGRMRQIFRCPLLVSDALKC